MLSDCEVRIAKRGAQLAKSLWAAEPPEQIERSDREIAALGDIEDDSYLDLPISIYAGG